MSFIKTEIQYPKNQNTYSIEAVYGKIDISRISYHEEKGKELYQIELDGIRNQEHEGRRLKIEVRRELMEEIVKKVSELFDVIPESEFSSSDGKTFYSHKPKTKSIEF